MANQVKQFEAHFPFGGLVADTSIQTQGPYTCYDAVNVRPSDVFNRRRRGGTRPGYGPSGLYNQLGSGAPVRLVSSMNVASEDVPTTFPEDFVGGSLTRLWTPMTLWDTVDAERSNPSVDGNLKFGYTDGTDTEICYRAAPSDMAKNLKQEVALFIAPWHGAYYGDHYLMTWLNADTPGAYTAAPGAHLAEGIAVRFGSTGTAGVFTWDIQIYGTGSLGAIAVNIAGGTFTLGYPVAGWLKIVLEKYSQTSDAWQIEIEFAGQSLYSNNVTLYNPTTSTTFGFGFHPTVANGQCRAKHFRHIYIPDDATIRPTSLLVASAGGKVYVEGWPRQFGGGAVPAGVELSTTCDLATGHPLMAAPFLQSLFIADYDKVRVRGEDGTNTDHALGVHTDRLYSSSIREVADWAAGVAVPLNAYRRSLTVKGNVYQATGIAGTGTTGGAEPAWDTTVGNTTIDNAGPNQITWTRMDLWPTDWTDYGISAANDVVQITGVSGSIEAGTYDILYVFPDYLHVRPANFGAVSGVCSFMVARAPKVLQADPENTDPLWESGVAVVVHTFRRPPNKYGKVYECTATGTTGGGQCPFASDDYVGFVVVDNTAEWTCRSMTLRKWIATTDKGEVPLNCNNVFGYNGGLIMTGDENGVYRGARLGNPYDWDFSARDPGSAFYSSLADAFQLSGPIKAAAVHGGDYVVFGLQNEIWVQLGDLRTNGYLVNVTRATGIVSPRAWCHGRDGQFVFLGTDGLYGMAPGSGAPVNVSSRRMPKELQGIDSNYFDVLLAYDREYDGYHIYLSGNVARPVSHFWYDRATDSFNRVDIYGDISPTYVYSYSNPDVAESHVVHGSFNGRLKVYRDLYGSDEDRVLGDYVIIGPIMLSPGGEREGVIARIVATLTDDSGPITATIRTGPTAEGVVNADLFAGSLPLPAGYRVSTLTFTAGLNRPIDVRQRGAFAAIILASGLSKRAWAIESIQVYAELGGKRRL